MSELEDLRAEVARLREACTEFENAYVSEHEERVAMQAALARVRNLADDYGRNPVPQDELEDAMSIPRPVRRMGS